VQWRFAGSAIAALSQFAIGVLLARLLPPADFGVIALALMVLGLAGPLGDLGVASAVVQRADLTERHVRTAFTFSVLFGVAVAIGLASAAPLAARVVRSADVAPVMRLLAVGFAIQGLSGVSAVLTALVTLCVVASLRWLLERLECSSATITFAILSGAAVPWTAGILWTLGRPDFEMLRERLPKTVRQLSLWMARDRGHRQATRY
jgi:PST family polysaccharide transporter